MTGLYHIDACAWAEQVCCWSGHAAGEARLVSGEGAPRGSTLDSQLRLGYN